MIRTFHSVGQGAFYTEKFEKFTMVYDCGGSNEELIKKEIKQSFNYKDTVNLLFISHFHEDHINGLRFLLDWCNVECVVLPYLNFETQIDFFLETGETDLTHFYSQLILSPLKCIKDLSRGTKVVFVKAFDINSEEGSETVSKNLEELQDKEEIQSGTQIHSQKIGKKWSFIPSNYELPLRLSKFKAELKQHNLNVSSRELFDNVWNEELTRDKLIQCFKNVKETANQDSMTVYSGSNCNKVYMENVISYPLSHKCRMYYLLDCCRIRTLRSGCLYFGDYDAKTMKRWKYISNVYDAYWDTIGTVQIPHHGSIDNYNVEINKKPGTISIISTGTGNTYGHPHSYVTTEIIKNHGYLFNVTEEPLSRVHITIGNI